MSKLVKRHFHFSYIHHLTKYSVKSKDDDRVWNETIKNRYHIFYAYILNRILTLLYVMIYFWTVSSFDFIALTMNHLIIVLIHLWIFNIIYYSYQNHARISIALWVMVISLIILLKLHSVHDCIVNESCGMYVQ